MQSLDAVLAMKVEVSVIHAGQDITFLWDPVLLVQLLQGVCFAINLIVWNVLQGFI